MAQPLRDDGPGDGGNRLEGTDRRAILVGLTLAVVGTFLFFVLVAALIGDPDPATTTTTLLGG
ncbi:MAG: hypothetical protein R3290_01845 [Acidimicrobiia bacterium]|nr:hypothetical protein [Acidimicrobiia bacterium]